MSLICPPSSLSIANAIFIAGSAASYVRAHLRRSEYFPFGSPARTAWRSMRFVLQLLLSLRNCLNWNSIGCLLPAT